MLKSLLYSYLSRFLPKLTCQKVKIGDVYICTFTENSFKNDLIFNSVSCGANSSWHTSLLKAQSEYVERKAFQASTCESTTGFAAFPYIFRRKRARKKAQANAYMEAVERYAWSEWWRNKDINCRLRHSVNESNKAFLEGIKKEFRFLEFYIILPKLAEEEPKLVILYAQIEEGLVCAAAVNADENQAEQNALKELYMHAIGLYRMKKNNIKPKSLYEKRIDWISRQKKRLDKRLSSSGTQAIFIPFPVVFQNMETNFHQAYVVERCFFKNYNKEFLSEAHEMYI